MTTLTKTKKILLTCVAALAGLGIITPLAAAADSTNQTDSTANIEFNIAQVKEKLSSQIWNGKVTEIQLKAKKNKDTNLNNTFQNPIYKVEVLDGNTEKEFKVDATTGEVLETKEHQITDNDKDKNLANENPSPSLEDATKKALEKYSNGKIKGVELEKENNQLVYEVRIIDSDTFHKLTIDTNNGNILNDQTKQKGDKSKDKHNKSENKNDNKNNNQNNSDKNNNQNK